MSKKGSMFSKRILVYKQNIDEQGRDLGEDQNVFVLDKNLILLEIHGFTTKVIKSFNIEKMTIFRMDANVDKSVIGRALVGGALTGGIGALVGGLSATQKNKSWFCEIIEKDGTLSLFRIKDESSMKALKKWNLKHQ